MKIISFILNIILILGFHLILFICYPETGKYGDYYFWISISIWTTFIMTINSNIKFIKLLSIPAKFFINLAIYTIMIFFISITMPQRDGNSVFDKIKSRKFPTDEDIRIGKIKYLKTILFKNLNNRSIENIKKAVQNIGKGEQ